MGRRILPVFLFFLLVSVLADSLSVAQQDETQVTRKVLTKVAPAYPELARRTNVHGVVKLLVNVAPDGKVTSAEVVGGNPVLVQAAVDAVRKWKYEPAAQQTHGVIELRFDTH